MVVIVGDERAAGLFGGVFPPREYIVAQSGAYIDAKSAVVMVLGGEARIKSAAAVIYDGDSDNCGFRLVGEERVQLIDCGMGAKSTVSVTSGTTDSLTLSLNRAVMTVHSASRAEPQELPVPRAPFANEYEHMAAFAATIIDDG